MSYTPQIGMKVVCIKNGAWTGDHRAVKPTYGQVCTIREVVFDDSGAWLTFQEIVNKKRQYHTGFHEAQFSATQFRPVQTRKTSIEIFNRILLNPRIRISEDA